MPYLNMVIRYADIKNACNEMQAIVLHLLVMYVEHCKGKKSFGNSKGLA